MKNRVKKVPRSINNNKPPFMRKKLHTENKRIIGGNIDKMGFILKEKMDPFSAKETRRIKFQRKKHNEREAARRPFKNNKVWKNSQKWKQEFETLPELDIISEESYQPHFGLETISAASFSIDALAKFANIDIPDKVLRELEGVILLLVNLSQQSTPLGVITSVLTWAQGRTTKSLFKTVKGFVEELLVSPQSSATPDWLDCLRDVRQNWKLCKSNRAFNQVSKLLGCLVMIGLCDVSSLEFNLGQFKVF